MRSLGFGLEKLGLFALRMPWTTFILVLIGCVVSVFGLIQIQPRGNLADLFESNSPAYKDFTAFSKRFPTSQQDVLLAVQGKNLLEPGTLSLLRDTLLDMQFVEGVDGILSMFAVHTPPDKNGETKPIFPPEIPEDPAEFKKMMETAKSHPLISGGLLASDAPGGPVALLSVTLKKLGKHQSSKLYRPVIDELVRTARESLEPKGLKVSVAGVPVMQKEIGEAIKKDRLTFTVGGFLFGSLICMLFFRKASLIIIASAAPLIAVLWALGMIGWARLNLNSFINVIPALIMVITFSDSLHMLFAIRRHLREGLNRFEAAREAIIHVGPACVLTSLTTSIAMFSLVLADSAVIKSFGIAAAFGTLIAFVVVIAIVPALTVLLVRNEKEFVAKEGENEGAFGTLDKIVGWLESWVIPNYAKIAVTGFVLLIAFSWFHLQLEPNYRLSDQIPDSEQSVQATKLIDSNLSGVYPIYISLNWGLDKKFNDPDVLEVIGKAHALMSQNTQIANIWSLDTVKKWFTEQGHVSAKGMADALEKLPEHLQKKLYTERYRTALVSGQIKNLPAKKIRLIVEDLKNRLTVLQAQYPDLVLSVNGLTVVSSAKSLNMIVQLKWSLLSAVVIVILLMGLAFRSSSYMLISIVPNLFPVVAVGTYLYLTGQGLQYASVMGLTVSFGLAVDDTIHFLNRYNIEVRNTSLMTEAVRQTLLRIGPVLVLSTLILIFGLSVTALSELPITRLFGELNMATLSAALLCDLIILPATLLFAWKYMGFGQHMLKKDQQKKDDDDKPSTQVAETTQILS